MLSAFYAEPVAASADAVWPYIAWESLELMLPGGLFRGVVYENREPVPGAVRRVQLAGGLDVVEQLIIQKATERRVSYRMIDLGAAPLSEYEGDVAITPRGPSACALRFACRYYPLSDEAPDFAPMYREMQRAFVGFIRSQVE
jgi:hypothetical protein